MMLRGRNEQCRLIDALIAEARSGRSRVMVLRGEPGIGKSALMQYAAETGPDFHVARADGVESEMELPYAAVHQLCRPMLDHLDRLPEPQAAALRIAFGLRAGPPPDRFLVSLAVLSLLSGQAESQPLLCLIDDAQWLDQASAQTLAFVARRLYGESVAFLVGIRDGDETDPFAGLPEVNLTGLADVDARTLLMSAIPGKLDGQVSERIVAESAGNPLALLELPHGWSAEGLAGGFGLPQSVPVRDRVEASFRRRIATLPAPTRMLLLVAAADPQGDPALLWRAASDLGIGFDAAAQPNGRGWCRSALVSPSGIRWSAPRSTGQHRWLIARTFTAPWPARPMLRETLIAARGIAPNRPADPTRTSPQNSNNPRRGQRPAVAWRRRRRFLKAHRCSRLIPPPGDRGRCRPRSSSLTPAHPRRRWRYWPTPRPLHWPRFNGLYST